MPGVQHNNNVLDTMELVAFLIITPLFYLPLFVIAYCNTCACLISFVPSFFAMVFCVLKIANRLQDLCNAAFLANRSQTVLNLKIACALCAAVAFSGCGLTFSLTAFIFGKDKPISSTQMVVIVVFLAFSAIMGRSLGITYRHILGGMFWFYISNLITITFPILESTAEFYLLVNILLSARFVLHFDIYQ